MYVDKRLAVQYGRVLVIDVDAAAADDDDAEEAEAEEEEEEEGDDDASGSVNRQGSGSATSGSRKRHTAGENAVSLGGISSFCTNNGVNTFGIPKMLQVVYLDCLGRLL